MKRRRPTTVATGKSRAWERLWVKWKNCGSPLKSVRGSRRSKAHTCDAVILDFPGEVTANCSGAYGQGNVKFNAKPAVNRSDHRPACRFGEWRGTQRLGGGGRVH